MELLADRTNYLVGALRKLSDNNNNSCYFWLNSHRRFCRRVSGTCPSYLLAVHVQHFVQRSNARSTSGAH